MSDDLEPLAPEEGIDMFLEHREPSVRESSMQNARHRLSVFLEWCDEEEVDNLNDLTGRDLSLFISWRQGDVAPITLQKQLSSVRMALRGGRTSKPSRMGSPKSCTLQTCRTVPSLATCSSRPDARSRYSDTWIDITTRAGTTP